MKHGGLAEILATGTAPSLSFCLPIEKEEERRGLIRCTPRDMECIPKREKSKPRPEHLKFRQRLGQFISETY